MEKAKSTTATARSTAPISPMPRSRGRIHPSPSGPSEVPAVSGATAGGSEIVADEIEQMIDLGKVEGRVRASSIKKIGEIVDKHPEEAVAIIRSWLYQDS